MSNGIRIRVKGKVQGVGFRPYVWQLAHRHQLCGNVSNDSAGVLIHLVMSPQVASFLDDLTRECPPLAHIDSIESHPYEWEQQPADFSIAHSGAGAMDTQV
ncbi:acylphosphatase, partial [Candidatus Symbiopectobacterium sp. NZEC135]